MKTTWLTALALSLSLSLSLTASCGSSEDSNKEVSADEAKAKATALVPGASVLGVERETPADEPVLLVVKLKLSNGAIIDAEYVAKDGSLFELKSETAPFDGYDITPHAGVLAYSKAKSKALETKAGTVEVWEFAATKTQWEFYVRDSATHLWEIKMAAADGSVTSVQEKVKPD
jgi:hypothetical protein